MENDAVIGPTYYQSTAEIQKGDRVMLDDNWCGCVQEVCLPGSDLARDYACEERGGLLILFDNGVLLVEPFGVHGCITKQL